MTNLTTCLLGLSFVLAGCEMTIEGDDLIEDGELDTAEADGCDPASGVGALPKMRGGWFQAIYIEADSGGRSRPEDGQFGRISFGDWQDNTNSVASLWDNATGTGDRLYADTNVRYRFLPNACQREVMRLVVYGSNLDWNYGYDVGADGDVGTGDDRLSMRYRNEVGPVELRTVFRRCTNPGCSEPPTPDVWDER